MTQAQNSRDDQAESPIHRHKKKTCQQDHEQHKTVVIMVSRRDGQVTLVASVRTS